MSGTVGLEVRAGTAWITLDRPEKLNALDAAMVTALSERLAEAAANPDIRVVVLRGAGRAFCAGYDLSPDAEQQPRTEADWRVELERDLELTLTLWALPKPTIAAVHGWCLGGALDLAIACDLAVAADDARFGIPEIKAGSGPVTMLLPFVVGQKRTSELVLTGDHVDAHEAERIGLVNRVVPATELEEATAALARRITPTPGAVLELTKLALVRAYEAMGLQQAQVANLDLMAAVNALDTPEQREFERITAADGLKAALAWRAARYDA